MSHHPANGTKRIKHLLLLESQTARTSRQSHPHNAIKWALAHNRPHDPNSATTDLTDFYDDLIEEIRRMHHTRADKRNSSKTKAPDYLI